MDDFIPKLSYLASKSLNKLEHTVFATLLKKIELVMSSLSNENLSPEQQEEKEKLEYRYSHDIEMNIICKIYKNNQKGERVELFKYMELPMIVKCPLGTDPEAEIVLIQNKIINK